MKRLAKLGVWMTTALVLGTGCKKVFDINPQDQLDESDAYQNVYDADAAVVGIYGKFMGLAETYTVLNELRGDLLNYTSNADENLRQISTHSATASNPYVNPRPFYELILNCNDALEHFQMMVRTNRMNNDQFIQRYSDIGALRSFLYLQLGIHYGQIPYVTKALKNVDDVKNASLYPKLAFNVLLDSLINFTEALPFKEIYPGGTNLNISVDGYLTDKFYVNKKCLLGDLYLWKGNYIMAATKYREVMEFASNEAFGENQLSQYKLAWWGTGSSLYVTYSRAGDASTLVYTDGWRTMFEVASTADAYKRELIWALPFDSKFKPDNTLVKLFSPIGGQYLVKPSQEVVDLWDEQVQKNTDRGLGFPYDARKLLSTATISGQRVAMKHLYNYINYSTLQPTNALVKNGKWFLYRVATLHLRYAEATNRAAEQLNRPNLRRLATGIVNSGIKGAYPAPTSDVTNYHNTLGEPAPFNFDARDSGGSGVPYYRAPWYRNVGVRGRASLVDMPITATTAADSTLQIERGILKEAALETAFEGQRWPDMLRIALRENNPSIIADKVYNKLLKDGTGNAAAVRQKLMDPANWYLPFNW